MDYFNLVSHLLKRVFIKKKSCFEIMIIYNLLNFCLINVYFYDLLKNLFKKNLLNFK